MSPLRLNGSTSGFSQLDAPAIAGDQTFTLPGTGGTLDRINRAGNILQVVSATYSTEVTSSSTTYADTGLTASITPSSASSKILIMVQQAGCKKTTGNIANALSLKLLRNSTDLIVFAANQAYTETSLRNYIGNCGCSHLDSPSTTSSVTYKTQLKNLVAASEVGVQTDTSTSTITLLEVAA